MRRPPRQVAALLSCLAALGGVAGCGAGGTPTTTATHQPASTAPPGSSLPLGVRLQRGIDACRTKMLHDAYIPAGERPTAAADCEGYKTGHLAPLYAIVEPACEAQVRATVPAAKQAASLTACKKVFAAATG